MGIFSLEMSKEQLVLRMLCADARVDAHRLRTGNLQEKDWARLAKAYADLSASQHLHRRLGHPHAAGDARQVPPPEGRARPRAWSSWTTCSSSPAAGRVENRQQEIAAISRSLKGLAKELAVPVIALSQLSRAPGGAHRRSGRSSRDLRESGAIEQDADIVMFIFREEEYKPTDENRGIAEIIIGKQRNGPTGTVKLAFIKEFTRFENLEWRGGTDVRVTPRTPWPAPRARARIDLDRLAANYDAIARRRAACRVMPVVKADAYGHGAVAVARRLVRAGAPRLAVAYVEEGVALRQAGIERAHRGARRLRARRRWRVLARARPHAGRLHAAQTLDALLADGRGGARPRASTSRWTRAWRRLGFAAEAFVDAAAAAGRRGRSRSRAP